MFGNVIPYGVNQSELTIHPYEVFILFNFNKSEKNCRFNFSVLSRNTESLSKKKFKIDQSFRPSWSPIMVFKSSWSSFFDMIFFWFVIRRLNIQSDSTRLNKNAHKSDKALLSTRLLSIS